MTRATPATPDTAIDEPPTRTVLGRPAPTRRVVVEYVRQRGVYVALLLLIAYNAVATTNFLTLDTIQLLFAQLPPIIIVSLGMALVIGTGGVDLSVGATMAIASSVLAKFVIAPGQGGVGAPTVVAVLAALVVGLLVGIFNGAVVAVARVQPIVVTLGVLVAGRGIALVITGGTLVELFVPFLKHVSLDKLGGIPYIMWIAGVLAVVLAVVVRRTAFGYRLLAIGGNLKASTLAGLPVRRTLITVYAISGLLAAIAGVIATARLGASDPSYVGLLFELSAITAVVVGGTPLSGGKVRILGTVAGAGLLQLLETTLVSHNVPDSIARIAEGAIIIGAVVIQQGGRRTR